jgi:hypothetical protein
MRAVVFRSLRASAPLTRGRLPLARVIRRGAALALLLGLTACSLEDSEWEAIRKLPLDVQASTYQRAIADLRLVCDRHREGLELFCHTQAQWVLKFPECDSACSALTSRVLTHAARPR